MKIIHTMGYITAKFKANIANNSFYLLVRPYFQDMLLKTPVVPL